MSQVFRDLLKKVGSGRHTSEALMRQEAEQAALLMLNQEATQAQIGAFLIAHRIRRPTAAELAGFLDAYRKIGPSLKPIQADYPTMVFGLPYDGRSRTSPAQPLVALMLSAMGCPVLLHGGNRMPTKYGLPLIEIWQGLGLNWQGLTLQAIQKIFAETLLGSLHLPDHFPEAQTLVAYREQIGKRPPLATLELMWCPYEGSNRVIVGYVHPPTEMLAQNTLSLTGIKNFMTVKGLEGSSDLPRARTAIVGIHQAHSEEQRLLLHARDYQLGSHSEIPLNNETDYLNALKDTLHGKMTHLRPIAIWNGGFYLWQSGIAKTLEQGFELADDLLHSDHLVKHIARLTNAIKNHRQTQAQNNH